MGRKLAGVVGLMALSGMAFAQSQPAAPDPAQRPVWRCPGPPVEYTNELSPDQARDRGCRIIEATPVTVVQPPPRPPAAARGRRTTASAA